MTVRASRVALLEAGLAVAVCLSRIPFLFAGYGHDPDAWRVAWTGREIVRTGMYQSSRAPGNPIPELVAAALASTPPWTMNALGAFFGAVAVILFGRLLRRLGCHGWFAGAVALAFTPVIAIHSTDSMDYVWALAFVLGAWLAALDRRPGLAGLLVGLATGCRITSLVMLVPLSILVVAESEGRDRRGTLATLWGAGIAFAAVAFSPVIVRSGLTFLHGYEHGYPALLYVAKNLTVDVWGVPGCVALALALGLILLRRGSTPSGKAALPARSGAVFFAAALAVVLELALFFRLPHEAAYLIPAVPFTLLLLARGLTRREFIALCACVAVSTFIVKVSEPGKLDVAPLGGLGGRMTVAGHAFEVDVLRGPLMTDHLHRKADLLYVERVRETARRSSAPSVIVAYEWLPVLRVMAGGSREGRVTYVYSPTRRQLDSLNALGVAVYDLPGAEGGTQAWWGYSLRAGGSRPLALSPR